MLCIGTTTAMPRASSIGESIHIGQKMYVKTIFIPAHSKSEWTRRSMLPILVISITSKYSLILTTTITEYMRLLHNIASQFSKFNAVATIIQIGRWWKVFVIRRKV